MTRPLLILFFVFTLPTIVFAEVKQPKRVDYEFGTLTYEPSSMYGDVTHRERVPLRLVVLYDGSIILGAELTQIPWLRVDLSKKDIETLRYNFSKGIEWCDVAAKNKIVDYSKDLRSLGEFKADFSAHRDSWGYGGGLYYSCRPVAKPRLSFLFYKKKSIADGLKILEAAVKQSRLHKEQYAAYIKQEDAKKKKKDALFQ